MKKYVIKATALAIGALVGGGAFAAVTADVNFDATTPVVSTYAKELAYNSTTPLLQAANTLNWQSKIGFGVSNGQTRYIRIDYANAKAHIAHGAVEATDLQVGAAGNVSVAKVAGGAAADTYVIYQITANTDLASTAVVAVKTPSLRVTSTASPVQVTYSLHETAVSAVAGATGSGLLYTKTGTIVKFATGVAFAVAPETVVSNVANVSTGFKKFVTTVAGDKVAAKLGLITHDVDSTTPVLEQDGTGVDMADLFGTNTAVVVKGDFSAVAGATTSAKLGNIYLNTAGDCVAKDVPATAFVTGGVSFTVGATAVAKTLCYEVTGTTAIPASTYTAQLDVDAATDSTTANVGATALASITRNGTELQAPFATIHADYLSRVVLTSQYSVDAPYVISAITEEGVTCTMGAGATGTLKAGTTKVIDVKTICASTNTGATRLAVNAIIDAPTNTVHGLYNVMNYDVTTGKTNSLISYPMVRPTEN